MRRGLRFGVAAALAVTLGAITAGCVATRGGGAGSAAEMFGIGP